MRMIGNNRHLLRDLDSNLKSSFSKIKEEFDDHKQSINDNTVEIHDVQDSVAELEERMNKFEERLDEIHLMISQFVKDDHIDLNVDEQKVFIVLYTFEKKSLLSCADMALKTGLEELSVKKILFSLVEKGVEIVEKKIEGRSFYKMHSEFRELQARENIVEIDDDVRAEVFNNNLNAYFFKE